MWHVPVDNNISDSKTREFLKLCQSSSKSDVNRNVRMCEQNLGTVLKIINKIVFLVTTKKPSTSYNI